MVYQTCDLVQARTEDLGCGISMFKVDGGASANNFLLQFQADMIGQPVYRPVCIETTSLGAAYLAGLATGYWKDQEDILSNWQLDRRFDPQMGDGQRNQLLDGWHKAVQRALEWSK